MPPKLCGENLGVEVEMWERRWWCGEQASRTEPGKRRAHKRKRRACAAVTTEAGTQIELLLRQIEQEREIRKLKDELARLLEDDRAAERLARMTPSNAVLLKIAKESALPQREYSDFNEEKPW